jgi:putative transposase
MRTLGLSGVRRDKGIRTTIPAREGKRASDLLDRDFTAGAPNRVWVTDSTYVRTWAGFVYGAFIVDCFAQRIVAWHASTSKVTDLVMIPLRMALWQRGREGHTASPGELIHHSDAGSQGGFKWLSQHLDQEVCAWDGHEVGRRQRRGGCRCGRLAVRRLLGVSIGSGSGSDRWGCKQRGRRCRSRGVASGWNSVVS